MKRIFYTCVASNKLVIFSFAALLLCGLSSKAQQWTIQFPNAPPALTTDPSLDLNDDPAHGIIFGTKFRVTRPGNLVGIRYLKGDTVGGTHIGNFWNKNRAKDTFELPATPACSRGWCGPGVNGQLNRNPVTFVNPPPFTGGWQRQDLDSVIFITPADTFLVTIWSSNGDYAIETGSNTWGGGGDFGGTPDANNPIRVIADLNDPLPWAYPDGNGVFLVGIPGDANRADNANNYPQQSNFAPNYWVDIVFESVPILPVTLRDFRATTSANNVLLSWKTETEQNNRGFGIERSNNGTDWYEVFFVTGASESIVTRNYSHTDKNLAPGTYYYRLNQKDYDGKSKISSVVTATISGKGFVSLFQNTPNPFSGITSIRFDLPRAQKVKLSVYDMTGREIRILTDQLSEAGSHQVNLDGAVLRKQQYLVKLQTETEVLTKKILVQ